MRLIYHFLMLKFNRSAPSNLLRGEDQNVQALKGLLSLFMAFGKYSKLAILFEMFVKAMRPLIVVFHYGENVDRCKRTPCHLSLRISHAAFSSPAPTRGR